MRMTKPNSWALSIIDLRSSGAPQQLVGVKKFDTWYLQHHIKYTDYKNKYQQQIDSNNI